MEKWHILLGVSRLLCQASAASTKLTVHRSTGGTPAEPPSASAAAPVAAVTEAPGISTFLPPQVRPFVPSQHYIVLLHRKRYI